MTKIIYLGGNRITDRDLTVGKVYEMIDRNHYDGVRVHDDIWDIHSITENAYREVIEQSVSIGDTVVITSKCRINELVGKVAKVIDIFDESGVRYLNVEFENTIDTEVLHNLKTVRLRDNRFVLVERASKPKEKNLTDDEIKELGELLSNITKYEDAYNCSKKRYKYSKDRIKELKQKGGLL